MQSFLSDYPNGSGSGILAPVVADYVDARVLAANTAERHTIPAGANFVNFSGDGDFWAKFGDNTVTAAIPSGDVTDGSAPMLNPGTRRIPKGVTSISLIAGAARNVTLEFWSA